MKKAVCLLASLACIGLSAIAFGQEPEDSARDAAPVVGELSAQSASLGAQRSAETVEHTYFDEFIDKLRKGGLTIVFLLLLSVAGIARIIERAVNLRPSTFATPGLVEKVTSLYKAGEFDEVMRVCRKDSSILGRIVLAVVDHRECDRGDIQNIASDIGSREIRIQLQKAYMLAIIATLSPLLGLFGTVIGMIGAFDTVAAVGEMGNASIMAGDIAKALVTTAGGLVVAMPMLGFYHWFRTRTQSMAIGLEEDMAELFSAWFLKNTSK
jgi:biopolymer transport protein ExbB